MCNILLNDVHCIVYTMFFLKPKLHLEMMTIISELHDCNRYCSNIELEWYIHIIFFCDFLS